MRKTLLAALLLGLAATAHAQTTAPAVTARPPATAPAASPPVAPSNSTTPNPTTPSTGATTGASTSTRTGTSTGTPATSRAHRTSRSLADRFADANTTHDGKLTLDQARAGHMPSVVRDFDQIDKQKRGYVTLDDIKTFRKDRRAARRAARAAHPAPQN